MGYKPALPVKVEMCSLRQPHPLSTSQGAAEELEYGETKDFLGRVWRGIESTPNLHGLGFCLVIFSEGTWLKPGVAVGSAEKVI